MIFVDSSSNSKGNGVVVLVSPQGEEIKLAMWFQFYMLNNEEEYKDLLNRTFYRSKCRGHFGSGTLGFSTCCSASDGCF